MTKEEIENKISNRLETLIQDKIDRNPEHYHKLWAGSGAGYGAGEWEYDEDKAREDVIEDEEFWQEDKEMMDLFGQLLWML